MPTTAGIVFFQKVKAGNDSVEGSKSIRAKCHAVEVFSSAPGLVV